MKGGRLPIVGALTLVLAGGVWYARRGRAEGFPSPTACLEAFREAAVGGDVSRWLACLEPAFRAQRESSVSAADLRRQMRGVKSWTELEPVVRGGAASVDVEQVRADGTWRIRYYFRRAGGGWLISAIDAPRAQKDRPRYGTPVE